MAGRVKEDERNERTIRGLLKLPENRRCINCNSLGPQYVCTNFWTFVCTTCSGIHREFTHRVKSVSMAKFTSQEVKALQEGGNQRSKEIYLKEWDPQRNSQPDSSNVERLRDFIKHVYVDKRYSGDRNLDKPPRTKTEESYENRRAESYHGGSRSPPYEDIERRSSAKSSPGKSPVRPEVVNDWRREDRFGNGKRHEERRMSEGDLKLEGKSPDLGSSSPPVVRPVREILGDNVIPLRIIEPPKPTPRTSEGLAHTQRTASSSSLGSVEAKVEPSVSLIDFDTEPEPPQQPTVAQPTSQQTTVPASSQPADSTNWASFDAFPQAKVSQTPNLNPMESVISELSAPSHTPAASVNNFSTFPLDGVSMAVPGSTNFQQPLPLIPASGQQFMTSNMGHANNQPWNSSLAPNAPPQGFPSNFTAQTSASALRPAVVSEPPPSSDTRLSGRQALPEDLFAINYSAYRAPVPGWQTGPPPNAMVYPMHYHPVMPVQNFQQPSKSMNPFDMSGEAPPVQAPPHTFPSMGSLQGALPNMSNPSNMPPSGLTGFGAPASAWMPQNSTLPPAYAPQMPPRGYMGQQVPDNRLPSSHHPQGAPEGSPFGFLNAEQQLHGRYSAPATPNPFPSSGGNPFG